MLLEESGQSQADLQHGYGRASPAEYTTHLSANSSAADMPHVLTPGGRVHLLPLSSGKGQKCSPGEGEAEFKSALEAAWFTRHSTGWSVEIAPWSPGSIHNEARETTGPLSARQLGGSLSLSNKISPHYTIFTRQSFH